MSEAPFEIIAGPLEAWVAPVGTAFPEVDTDPPAPWAKIGTNGARNISEDGVTVTHNQSVETWRSLKSTGPVKAFRTEEELHVAFALMDLTAEQYARVLNDNTVTDDAPGVATPGIRTLGLSRGRSVAQRALLLRGTDMSAYADGLNAQYEIPVAVQVGEPEVVFVKGEPAGLALEFQALEDPNATEEDERFGRLVVQDAEAGT